MNISPQDYQDECPVHGGEQVAEYSFGMSDATIIKHSCGCCLVADDSGLNDMIYYRSYNDALGLAKMTVAKANLDDRVFREAR